ncbi:similar to Saccharomyces cerevisiae YMR074C Protein with homology to human PDCD5, which is involved in programmed cell death [Geotrichum candidum]|uniref:Similar to Saccharomyces cerevisiae YMR074C Protein with homology to human PDCD5, which is involved in programmed cell death n=1 Tax=Geotrichum candidum TaxID=1173061 RepID=A0A0J9X2Y8_GEOCN|nr:similar to Saccharomyces cerevisiae YMR074C Protein with homology to human PDCD5, which is involved in programmed cell death [Geotrichum candidum]
MDDSELQAIRQARMAELQKQQGGASGGAQAGGSAGNASNDQQQRAAQEEDMRASMLAQVLSPEARERLSRIRIVRAERARSVEDLLIRLVRSGQIQKKVSEQELISLLEQLSQQESKANKTKIVFERRNTNLDNDDDDDDFFD